MNKKIKKALGIYAMIGEYFVIKLVLEHGCPLDEFLMYQNRQRQLEWKLRWFGKIACRLAGVKLPKPRRAE